MMHPKYNKYVHDAPSPGHFSMGTSVQRYYYFPNWIYFPVPHIYICVFDFVSEIQHSVDAGDSLLGTDFANLDRKASSDVYIHF